MRDAPAYSGDRFPADFAVALVCAGVACLISGPAIWYFSLAYLQRTYPRHSEMTGAAVMAGLLDGALIGVGVFVVTFAIRVYLYERRERQRSDVGLKLTLEEIAREGDGR